MVRKMRRDDKLIQDQAKMDAIINKANDGILSTISDAGYPYAIPMNYTYVNGFIYLHGAKEGHKLDNIQKNNNVCFTIVGTTELKPEEFSTDYESIVIFGKATIIDSKEEKIEALKSFIEKFSPEFSTKGYDYVHRAVKKTALIKIQIEEMTGKSSYSKE